MFDALQKAFAAHAAGGREQGAAVAVCRRGELCASLCCGALGRGLGAWQSDTLVPVFSATKAASAACLLTALYECAQGPELEVGALWPAFPAPHLTVGELLSHQAGLAATSQPASVFDLEACRAAVEHSTPMWGPPQHGYHPHTFGPMLDVLMLELTGLRIGDWWETRVRAPLGWDFYIGRMPEAVYPRVAVLEHAKTETPLPSSPFFRAYFDPHSAVYRAFHSVVGLETLQAMNAPAAWQCACPARGGVASAAALALFYQALLGYVPAAPFPQQVAEWMRVQRVAGADAILQEESAFTCGAMCGPASLFCGGFGHPGAGGSLGWCLPSAGISFAYVMNRLEPGALPGARVRGLVKALLQDLQAAGEL